MVWLVFISWVISYANEWEDYSNYLGDGAETSWIWATAHSLVLVTWNCHGTSGCVISLADSGSRSSLVYHLWSHLILISLCCVLGLCHSFKSCALPLSLLLHQCFWQWDCQGALSLFWVAGSSGMSLRSKWPKPLYSSWYLLHVTQSFHRSFLSLANEVLGCKKSGTMIWFKGCQWLIILIHSVLLSRLVINS